MEMLKATDNPPVQFPAAVANTGVLLRKLFWLRVMVGLLLLSNLFIGAIAVWAVRKSDNSYSSLLESKLPLLEKLGNIGVDYSRLQRRYLNLFLVDAKEEEMVRKDFPPLQIQAKTSLQAAHAKLGDAGLSLESAELNKYSDSYLQALERFDQLMREKKRTEASEFARLSLRPSLEALLRYSDQLDAQIRGDVLRQAEQISTSNSVFNRLMLGLAGWPLFFILGAVALFVVIVAMMLVMGLRLRLDERE